MHVSRNTFGLTTTTFETEDDMKKELNHVKDEKTLIEAFTHIAQAHVDAYQYDLDEGSATLFAQASIKQFIEDTRPITDGSVELK